MYLYYLKGNTCYMLRLNKNINPVGDLWPSDPAILNSAALPPWVHHAQSDIDLRRFKLNQLCLVVWNLDALVIVKICINLIFFSVCVAVSILAFVQNVKVWVNLFEIQQQRETTINARNLELWPNDYIHSIHTVLWCWRDRKEDCYLLIRNQLCDESNNTISI